MGGAKQKYLHAYRQRGSHQHRVFLAVPTGVVAKGLLEELWFRGPRRRFRSSKKPASQQPAGPHLVNAGTVFASHEYDPSECMRG